MNTFETLPFYRGFSNKYKTDEPSLIAPRRDRRPKNSSAHFHHVADEWFKNRFGIQYRSQGVFLTSRLISASTYAATPAHVMRVVPIGIYAYCWSPKVSDLLFAATDLASSSRDVIESYLDSAQYRDTALQDAHASGHEVMLHCERYITIPIHLLGVTLTPESKSIILTG